MTTKTLGLQDQTRNKETGYFIIGPRLKQQHAVLKNGNTVFNYHRNGIAHADVDSSPWHEAALFVQGTLVSNADDEIIAEVALFETVDARGDVTWGTSWQSGGGGAVSLQSRTGTGSWLGITGHGSLRAGAQRADDYTKYFWDMDWMIDKENCRGINVHAGRGTYKNYDKGFSMHGPHIADAVNVLSSGLTLVANHQPFGVRISEDLDTVSPRHFAVGNGRGTTIKENDKVIGDVMLIEDMDPDGDIAWLFHEFWYTEDLPFGTHAGYWYLGGTGKWDGIKGVCKPLKRIRVRNDVNNMIALELSWTIEEQ